jgi:hypothetical protein
VSDDRTQALLDHLTKRIRYLEAEIRRAYDDLDWRDEKIRVLTRVIERLGRRP